MIPPSSAVLLFSIQSWVAKGTYLFGCSSPNGPFNAVYCVKRKQLMFRFRCLSNDGAESDIWYLSNQQILINLSTHTCRTARHLVRLSMGGISPSIPRRWKTLMGSLRWVNSPFYDKILDLKRTRTSRDVGWACCARFSEVCDLHCVVSDWLKHWAQSKRQTVGWD